jgi:hypothetical protein
MYSFEKSSTKVFNTYVSDFRKTGQSKEAPIGRKFAQSGHPVVESTCQSEKHLFQHFQILMRRKLSTVTCVLPSRQSGKTEIPVASIQVKKAEVSVHT